MTTLNDGRNEVRIGNSDAKCLIENWVEEVSDLYIPIYLIVLNLREICTDMTYHFSVDVPLKI